MTAPDVPALPTCPWCGHDDDCQPGIPGESPHHFLCCLDRHNPTCLREDRSALDRIMRDDRAADNYTEKRFSA